MDFLDILQGRYEQTYNGRYYKKLPTPAIDASEAAPQPFDYEHVDVTEWRYQQLIGNLIVTDAANTTIKTRTSIKFTPNTHVALQDGNLYLITSITEDPRSVPKEAARIMVVPVGLEKVIRLRQVDDPWGIGGAR